MALMSRFKPGNQVELKEKREPRQVEKEWSQDNVLIKAPRFNGDHASKEEGETHPPLVHSWSLEPAAGNDVQDRA